MLFGGQVSWYGCKNNSEYFICLIEEGSAYGYTSLEFHLANSSLDHRIATTKPAQLLRVLT